jgi:hypothetical protein
MAIATTARPPSTIKRMRFMRGGGMRFEPASRNAAGQEKPQTHI